MRPFARSTILSVFAAFSISAQVIYAQVTPDEQNTMEVFKSASQAVVHVKAKRLLPLDLQEPLASMESAGSGFVIDASGHILTNYHVIDGASEVRLVVATGEMLEARLIGTAPALDLALLQADFSSSKPTGLKLQPIALGDSSTVEVGQKVLAIGNPLGFQNTLTVGVLSGTSRDIPGAPAGLGHAFLQTDAAVNPGNSGGPLLNSRGEAIGINAVTAREGQNIGFAIPINLIKQILPDLIRMGHIYQPPLGFSAVPLTPGLAALFGLPVGDGLLIQEVIPESPAALAGLSGGTRMVPMGGTVYVLGGDILTAINEKPLSSLHEMTAVVMNSKTGDRLNLSVLRDGRRLSKVITLPPMHFR